MKRFTAIASWTDASGRAQDRVITGTTDGDATREARDIATENGVPRNATLKVTTSRRGDRP